MAITTSAAVEVALSDGQREVALAGSGQALEALLPTVQDALKQFGTPLDAVRYLGVCTGPGSFTGLRIGVAFAKTLAQARGLGIVGVSAYDVAQRSDETLGHVAVVEGKKNYYYARIIRAGDRAPLFAHGDVDVVRAVLEEAGHSMDPAELVFRGRAGDRARAVARIARQIIERGGSTRWQDIVIDYGQRPSAVVKWEARGAQGGQKQQPANQRGE